jgi:hypothetical protein
VGEAPGRTERLVVIRTEADCGTGLFDPLDQGVPHAIRGDAERVYNVQTVVGQTLPLHIGHVEGPLDHSSAGRITLDIYGR